MLKTAFDPRRAYRVVIYARMSSAKQNHRSPDQQVAEIKRRLKTLGLRWVIVKVYRDDAKSGRYLRTRPGYQQMMREIKTGVVAADLILVDTKQRFGRVKELPTIRHDLQVNHGILVLTANSNFADPTTPQGHIVSTFEDVQATQDNDTKAHDVLRGKVDLAQRGFWPGGPRPFGLKFVPVVSDINGQQVFQGNKLGPYDEEDWIIKLLFKQARETGHGQTRLARFLNEHDQIPDQFKPFYGPTVGFRLDQTLYCGDLTFNEYCTGVVADTRRLELNPEEEIIRIRGFCEAVVDPTDFDTVQAMRERRRRRAKKVSKGAAGSEKQIAPLAPGMSLTYPLTGLVRCANCGSSMRPVTSGRKSKAGKKYVYYACPRYIDRICDNDRYIPEEWLRQTVLGLIRDRLFPC